MHREIDEENKRLHKLKFNFAKVYENKSCNVNVSDSAFDSVSILNC